MATLDINWKNRPIGTPLFGAKVYNNYCVVSNNTNQETVGNDSIYVIDSNGEYHKPGCLKLINDLKNNNVTITGAYASSEFERKTVSITGEDSNAHSQLLGGDVDSGKYAYYYPEAYTPCYSCMVSAIMSSVEYVCDADTIQE